WKDAAAAWREAMRQEAYFETSTVFSLTPTPAEQRGAVRAELTVADAPLGAAHALALLEVAWGSPRSGWQVLSVLAVSDTAVAWWMGVAVTVERGQARAAARDALAAVHAARPDVAVALRAARAALRADDAAEGLRFARDAAERLAEPEALREALPLELD